MKPDEPTEEQRDEAALWLARKTGGSLTPETAAAFETWLNADRRHRRAYDEARVLFAQLEAPARRLDAVAPLRRKLAVRLEPRWSWLLAPIAPVIALLIVWLVNPAVIQNWQADIVTSRQLVSTITLPDGSIAHLGADTALALDFAESHRRVRLLRGEAYFEVRHGASGAFTVEANGDEIRDIGTKFDVDLIQDQTQVVVAEGAVEVAGRADATPVILRLGDQVVVKMGRLGRVQSVDPDLALAWMSGRLVVQGATVADAAAALQRHTRSWIIVRGGLAQRQISGSFPLTNVDDSLSTIAAAVKGTVVHVSPLVTVLY